MKFQIEDLEFRIEKACIDCFIDEEDECIVWGIDIFAQGHDWSPHLCCETLFSTPKGGISNWFDIGGVEVSWLEALDEDDEPRGVLSIFEHEPLYDCSVSLLKGDDSSIEVALNSRCDVFWNDRYSKNLSLQVEAPLVFNGILMGRLGEREARRKASGYLNLSEFSLETDKNGVSILKPRK